MKAWHFLREDKKLGYKDNRLVRVGHTFKCDPDSLEMCESGFHASKRIIDALKFAPGPIVCRVELGGRIIKDNDKCVASERTVIAMADATATLHEFACWCAERALEKVKNPDPRSIAAIEAKRKWLRGEISDRGLSAAESAARSAAWSAAESAARSAAWSAAWSAARSAAWSAARPAAWSAASAARSEADWAARPAASAARSAQSRKLTRMCRELLK